MQRLMLGEKNVVDLYHLLCDIVAVRGDIPTMKEV